VREYRVYCFDGASRIMSADWISAINDAEAYIQTKTRLRDCFRVELWDRDRLVGRIDPPPSQHA